MNGRTATMGGTGGCWFLLVGCVGFGWLGLGLILVWLGFGSWLRWLWLVGFDFGWFGLFGFFVCLS